MKIHPAGTELFQVNRWTDGRDKTNTRFSKFRERLKMFSYTAHRF
jgi:hypothetical protein